MSIWKEGSVPTAAELELCVASNHELFEAFLNVEEHRNNWFKAAREVRKMVSEHTGKSSDDWRRELPYLAGLMEDSEPFAIFVGGQSRLPSSDISELINNLAYHVWKSAWD